MFFLWQLEEKVNIFRNISIHLIVGGAFKPLRHSLKKAEIYTFTNSCIQYVRVVSYIDEFLAFPESLHQCEILQSDCLNSCFLRPASSAC